MGIVIRALAFALALVILLGSAAQTSGYSSSGGCSKGKSCGGTCISMSDTCHVDSGSTHRPRRRR